MDTGEAVRRRVALLMVHLITLATPAGSSDDLASGGIVEVSTGSKRAVIKKRSAKRQCSNMSFPQRRQVKILC